jgi:hypothetical protein
VNGLLEIFAGSGKYSRDLSPSIFPCDLIFHLEHLSKEVLPSTGYSIAPLIPLPEGLRRITGIGFYQVRKKLEGRGASVTQRSRGGHCKYIGSQAG